MSATAPLYTVCPTCRRRVLEVRHDWHEGILIGEPRIDPVTLDHQQVTACVIAGITLWQIHEHAGHHVTSKRSRWWPRRPIPGHIAPVHQCGRVWDAFPLNLAPADHPLPERCPF